MRFSNALSLPQPLLPAALDGLLRKMGGEAQQQEPVPAPQRELPEELDQRVRELGEW